MPGRPSSPAMSPCPAPCASTVAEQCPQPRASALSCAGTVAKKIISLRLHLASGSAWDEGKGICLSYPGRLTQDNGLALVCSPGQELRSATEQRGTRAKREDDGSWGLVAVATVVRR
mmetsp:Transcript_35972/g.86617  ORF Transcript_35972/g.86617 Transcript_35972/m.86617 type:complete len:117 (-) Transcript_35972:18-368(-)